MAKKDFYSLKDLQDLIPGWKDTYVVKEYLDAGDNDPEDLEASGYIQEMMSDPNAITELAKIGKPFLKKYLSTLKSGRSIFEPRELNLKNLNDVLGSVYEDLKVEDIKNQDPKYISVNGKILKDLVEEEGWDMKDVLKLVEETQNKQARQKIYDDNLLVRTVFPRTAEAIKETGDFNGTDLGLDIGENVLQAMPMAGVGTKVATQGLKSGLKVIPSLRGFLIENATAPTVMAAADELRKDDPSLANFGERALTGTAVNAAAGRMLGAGIRALIPEAFAIRLEKWMNTSGDEALKRKLAQINSVLEDRMHHTPEEVKKATNELNLLIRQEQFTRNGVLPRSMTNPTGSVSIADYAANNSNAKKVGKLARKEYEKELEENAGKAWAKKVRKNEKRYEPNSAYFTNRETVFPHMFVDDQVGAQAGLLKTTGQHKLDQPEFRIFEFNDLEPDNTIKNQIDKMFADHHSKKFHYGITFDEIVDGVLKDPELTSAIIRAYGGVNPREAVSAYITNKLGRSEWLRRQQGALTRLFGNLLPEKKKNKDSDEEE